MDSKLAIERNLEIGPIASTAVAMAAVVSTVVFLTGLSAAPGQ